MGFYILITIGYNDFMFVTRVESYVDRHPELVAEITQQEDGLIRGDFSGGVSCVFDGSVIRYMNVIEGIDARYGRNHAEAIYQDRVDRGVSAEFVRSEFAEDAPGDVWVSLGVSLNTSRRENVVRFGVGGDEWGRKDVSDVNFRRRIQDVTFELPGTRSPMLNLECERRWKLWVREEGLKFWNRQHATYMESDYDTFWVTQQNAGKHYLRFGGEGGSGVEFKGRASDDSALRILPGEAMKGARSYIDNEVIFGFNVLETDSGLSFVKLRSVVGDRDRLGKILDIQMGKLVGVSDSSKVDEVITFSEGN